MPCSVARTLDVVGEWWTLLVVRDVLYGLHRFDDIQADLGIARNVLADRLRTLVGRGVLERRPYSQRPVRHEYHLTEKGRDLLGVIAALLAWGDRWEQGPDGPPLTLVHRTCGHDAGAQVVCGHCGRRLRYGDVRAVATRGDLPPGRRPPAPDGYRPDRSLVGG